MPDNQESIATKTLPGPAWSRRRALQQTASLGFLGMFFPAHPATAASTKPPELTKFEPVDTYPLFESDAGL
ncbi:hypothetical protein [Planctomicrobium piriforme]|nr:hypothetical protein [Planctomicrobium piriforme]